VHPKPRNQVMHSRISSKHCSFIGIAKVVIDSLSIVLQSCRGKKEELGFLDSRFGEKGGIYVFSQSQKGLKYYFIFYNLFSFLTFDHLIDLRVSM
jgi:hypothetical protein